MRSAIKNKGEVGPLGIDETDLSPRPDYSIDRWIQQAKEFGSDLNKMRVTTDKEDDDLDKKKADAEKKADDEDKKAKPDKPESNKDKSHDKDKDPVWKKLRQIHQKTLAKVGQGNDSSVDDGDDE
jgi:hypothetical protein